MASKMRTNSSGLGETQPRFRKEASNSKQRVMSNSVRAKWPTHAQQMIQILDEGASSSNNIVNIDLEDEEQYAF